MKIDTHNPSLNALNLRSHYSLVQGQHITPKLDKQ